MGVNARPSTGVASRKNEIGFILRLTDMTVAPSLLSTINTHSGEEMLYSNQTRESPILLVKGFVFYLGMICLACSAILVAESQADSNRTVTYPFPVTQFVEEPLTVITGTGKSILDQMPILEGSYQFTAVNNNLAVFSLGKNDDQYKCIVYNLETQSYLAVTSGRLAGHIVFLQGGETFLIPTLAGREGPIKYSRYNLHGELLGQLTLNSMIAASPKGNYLYTIPHPLMPYKPEVYTYSLNPHEPIMRNIHDSRDWDTFVAGDSLYVLRDGSTIRTYNLETGKLLRESSIFLNEGVPLTKLYCNSTGKICAVLNFKSFTIVNTVTGESQSFEEEFVNDLFITQDAMKLYMIDSRQGNIRIVLLRNDGQVFNRVDSVELSIGDFIPGSKAALINTVDELPGGMLINFSSNVPGRLPTSGIARTLQITDFGYKKTGIQVILMDGPSWLNTSGKTRTLHTFEETETGNTLIATPIQSYEPSRK